jgi:hypothetical protein
LNHRGHRGHGRLLVVYEALSVPCVPCGSKLL